MEYIFKKFLKGLQYLFTLPILVVVLSIVAVIGVGMFIFIGIKAIFLYFTGRNIFGEFPEDIKAKEIIERKMKEQEMANNPQPVQSAPINQFIYNNPIPQPQNINPGAYPPPNPSNGINQNYQQNVNPTPFVPPVTPNEPVKPNNNDVNQFNNFPPISPIFKEPKLNQPIQEEPKVETKKDFEPFIFPKENITPIKEEEVPPSLFEEEPEEKNIEEMSSENDLEEFIPRYEDIAPKRHKKGDDNLIDPLSYRGMNYDREKKNGGDK